MEEKEEARPGRRGKGLTVGLPFIFGMDLNRNRDLRTGNQTQLDLGVCFCCNLFEHRD